MIPGDKMKWIFTFFIVSATIGWAAFLVKTVEQTMLSPTPINVLEVSGVSILLGAMINWCGNAIQFWFRKKPKGEEPIEVKKGK
jgi:hypothetical protein